MRHPAAGRHAPLLLVLLPLVAAAPARADTVIFRHGTRLECKVVARTEGGLRVLLPDAAPAEAAAADPDAPAGEGERPLPYAILDPGTIARIDYDFESRTEALEAEDWQGHYGLGLWAEEMGMRRRALMQYLYVQGKPDVPPEVFVRIGRLYEAVRPPEPEEAAAAYRRYLRLSPGGGAAEEAREGLARLAKEAAEPDGGSGIRQEERGVGTRRPPGGSLLVSPDDVPADGLETGAWQRAGWGNEGAARMVRNTGGEGDEVQELRYRAGSNDKAAFTRSIQQDLSAAAALVFDVYNPTDREVKLAVALTTLPGYTWFESRVRTVAPRSWTIGVRFDLTREVWKEEATGWRYVSKPRNLDNVQRLSILIYDRQNSGTLYLDRVRFEQEPPPE
jgi:hypothetical protein